MMVDPQLILRHLWHRLPAMVELLETLVRAESPSSTPRAQRGWRQLLGPFLADLGFRIRPVGDHLLAVPDGWWAASRQAAGARGQLILGHGDTVWPLGSLRDMPWTVGAGQARGPGVYDMKAGLVQGLFALSALRCLQLRPTVAPVVFVNGDEEIGSPTSRRHILRLARVMERVFVLEPSLGPEGLLKTARKGVGKYTVRVLGRAAHAGLEPEAGASAILELSHVIRKLFALNDPERGITVNVGMVDGGLRPNVIAPESRAVVEVRVPTAADGQTVETAILALAPETPGVRLEITGGLGRPPMEPTPGNRELWGRARRAAEVLGLALGEGTAGGGSDGSFTSALTPTLDGLGAVGAGAHAQHESVSLEAMPERAALLATLLLDPPLKTSLEPPLETMP
jgi:glutamate carboxypeptidase